MTDTIPMLRAQRRWYTPAEANALLPELIPLVEALDEGIERARDLAAMLQDAEELQDKWAVSRDLAEIQDANREILGILEGHEVELKGLEPAMLDFPALHQGQEVYLCWRQGEDKVSHWHPLHTGARGRQPLEPDADAAFDYWS